MWQTFAALAEPNRLRIVDLLRSGPQPVLAISALLELRQPQVSKHLRVLKEAGLVAVTPEAQQRHYHLELAPLREFDRWLQAYRTLWEARFESLDEVLTELKTRDSKKERNP